MRRRLLIPMLTLMAVALLALAIPLAAGQARAAASNTYLDRLDDAARFASLAHQLPRSVDQPLDRELRRYEQVYGISAALLDRDGNVLAASHPDFRPPAHPDAGWLEVALGGRRPDPPSRLWPWDRSDLVIAEPVIDGGDVVGVVVTVSPTQQARAAVLAGWGVLAAVIILAMGVCVLLAMAIARWILRPVRVVDRVSHDIATGELTARVPVEHGPPELRRLASSFNEMADSLATTVDLQRSFVADASHQLRNQLHALMLRLDGLSLSEHPEVAQDAELAAAEGRRLATMLDRLLELARAEQGQSCAPHPLDLVEMVDRRIQVWQPAAAARGIRLRRIAAQRTTAAGDEFALDAALDVLLDNAIKFAPADSTISVTVAFGPNDATVCVADRGAGLEPDELACAGRRFWRSRRHQNVPGSGLGLAIARAVLSASGADLGLANDDGRGLRATIRLPHQPAVAEAATP